MVGQEDGAVMVVRENDHPADKPDRWTAFVYRPGLDWNRAKGVAAEPRIVALCQQVGSIGNLNWNDNRTASGLYWAHMASRK